MSMTFEQRVQRLERSPTYTPQHRVRRGLVVPPNRLKEARALMNAGKTRSAYSSLTSSGEFKDFAGAEAQLVAGDVAEALGAPRLARFLHFRAWRSAPNLPDAQAAGLAALWHSQGLYAVWRRLRGLKPLASAGTDNGTHKLWLLRAYISAGFQDFETAEQFVEKAREILPQNPALHVAMAHLRERENRLDEALVCAQEALELRPGYPRGIRAAAHLLQMLNREQESLALLVQGAERVQEAQLLLDLISLQRTLGQSADVRASVEKLLEISPILEPELRDWALSLRTQAAWQSGQLEAAVASAREHGTPEALAFAERISATEKPRRVQLSVPFVRQHADTCAPATLSALSQFWGQPAPHLTVAEEICYAGTPLHASRLWAERQGWMAREFTVTWDCARALVERGVPFVMFTRSAASGHAQAVIGFDEATKCFVVRDSNVHQLVEYDADKLLAEQKLTGPAALVFVPADRSSLLEGVNLPDAALRDGLHKFQVCLEGCKRDEAAEILKAFQAAGESPLVTFWAELALAAYDRKSSEALGIIERLLPAFPDNEQLLLAKLSWMNERAQRADRLALLARACASSKCSPPLILRYASELKQDLRELEHAASWARRAVRKGFAQLNVDCLAAILWAKGQMPEALELLRFVACLNDKEEAAAKTYFAAARYLNQTEAALAFLKGRLERYGRRSPHPSISFYVVLEQLGRRPEAAEVLTAALKLRPHDSELHLFAAEAASSAGKHTEAEEHLRAAEGLIPEARRVRTMARIASRQRTSGQALVLWRQLLEREPLAMDAHQELAQLLAQTQGRNAAIKHLEQACQANPNHFELHLLLYRHLAETAPHAARPILQRLLELNPADIGLRCAWARCLIDLGRRHEALNEAETIQHLNPRHPASHALRGAVYQIEGNHGEAQAAFRKAIILSAEYDYNTISSLMRSCTTVMEQRLALNFLQAELSRHLIFGDGLLAFRDLAARYLDPPEVLASLQQSLRERPDLWHAWAALARQWMAQGYEGEAVEMLQHALAKMPQCAALWQELALVHQSRRDYKAELEAREKVLALLPGDPSAMHGLANCLHHLEEIERAQALLEETLRAHPRDAVALFMLGALAWKRDNRAEAVACAKEAVNLDPELSPAWEALEKWGRVLKEPGLLLDTAQAVAKSRNEDPNAWLRLARLQLSHDRSDDAAQSLDLAIGLWPSGIEAQTLKIKLLLQEDRFAEAQEICRSSIWGSEPPPGLRAMEACILNAEGKITEAFEKMEAALKEAPQLVWAWETLAGWYVRDDKKDEAKAVMQRLAIVRPHEPAPLLWMAAWKQAEGDSTEASDLLEKALRLQPGCVDALIRLMALQVKTRQFSAVRDTLAVLRIQGMTDWATAGEVCIALEQKDLGCAVNKLTDLLGHAGAQKGAVDTAIEAFRALNAEHLLKEPLERALQAPEVFEGAGALWIDVCAATGAPSVRKLLKLPLDKPLGRGAVIQYLRWVTFHAGQGKAGWRTFNRSDARSALGRIKRKVGDWLRTDNQAWIEFAAALHANQFYSSTRAWIGDWRSRKNLRPHYNKLFEIFCTLGMDPEALEIGEEAIRREEHNRKHRAKLQFAWLQVNVGQAALAGQCLKDLQKEERSAALRDFVAGVNSVHEAQPERRRELAREVFRSAKRTFSGTLLSKSSGFLKRQTRRSVAFLADSGAGFGARLWVAIASRRPV